MDVASPQQLSDQELLNRLRELGDTTTKTVTPKNRQIMEKKMNHLVAAVRKKEREALAAATAHSKSPRRTPAPSAKAKIGRVIKSNVEALVGATNQKPSEFSDSDIDRSPSRNRRSKRSSFNPDTSFSQKPLNGGAPHNYQGTNATQESIRSSRKSSGVNTSYNLDETLLDRSHNFQAKDKQIRPLKNTPEVNNRARPCRRSSIFSKGDTSVETEVRRVFESTRCSDYITAEPKSSVLRNHPYTKLASESSPTIVKQDLKTFRCSKLSFLFFAVIVASIATAIYFREPCIGEHCASHVKLEDRLRKMSAIAASVMGSYECGYSTSKDLRVIDMTFDHDPSQVLKFALENEASDITFSIFNPKEEVISSAKDYKSAEKIRSVMSSKTLWCRFRQSFAAVTMALFYLILGVFGIVGLLVIIKIYLHRRKKYIKRVDELVRGIILTVKSQASKTPPYIPIAHVRDRLLTSEEKKCSNRIWDRAVIFLSHNESRLRTENQIIKGEEYMVWHWVSLDDDNEPFQEKPQKLVLKKETHELLVKPVPITVTNVNTTTQPVTRSDPESIEAHPRVPTGEDMEVPASQSRPTSKLASCANPVQKGRKSITLGPCSGWSNYDRSFIEIYPPTRCLKLKNLALVETGNSGLDIAKASVIERIKQHKFNVYSVDCDHRSEETAIYICCVDNTQAADIYKLFFEQKYNGETVQVKFLKLEKYLERFPFLRNCVG